MSRDVAQLIVGMDEVGRGCLAGPLVVGAVILPLNIELMGLRDSKQMTAKARMRMSLVLRRQALAVGLGWASASEIDELGLTAALRLAGERALAELTSDFSLILLDGKHNYLESHRTVRTIIGGDNSEPSIAAASVLAKVARDAYMRAEHRRYPAYGFDAHVGYGTAKHLAAIAEHGASPLHRLSFKPLKADHVAN